MSIHDPKDPYDYSSYGGGSVGQIDYSTESDWTRITSSYAPSEQIRWDMDSFFHYAPPPTQYEKQPPKRHPSHSHIPQQPQKIPQQVFILQYLPMRFLIRLPRLPVSQYHYYITE